MTKLLKKYENLLKGSILTESEIIALKSRLTGNACSLTDEEVSILDEMMWDCEYNITQDHSDKGINYLRSKLFKSNGQRRDTKITRELSNEFFLAVLNFERFTFVGFHTISNGYRVSKMPIWRIYTKDGHTLDYCMNYDLSFIEVDCSFKLKLIS